MSHPFHTVYSQSFDPLFELLYIYRLEHLRNKDDQTAQTVFK